MVDENRDLLFLSSMPIRNLEKGAEAGLHQYPPMPQPVKKLVLTLLVFSSSFGPEAESYSSPSYLLLTIEVVFQPLPRLG